MSRGDIVVAQQDQIEVYVSGTGHVCIKQTSWDGEDDVITIDPIHVETICKALAAKVEGAKKTRNQWLTEDPDADS